MSRKLPLRSSRLVDGQTLSMAIRISQLEEELSVSETARSLLVDELSKLINLTRNTDIDPATKEQLLKQVESVLRSTEAEVSEWFYTVKELLALVINWRDLLGKTSLSGKEDDDHEARVKAAESQIIKWIDVRMNLKHR